MESIQKQHNPPSSQHHNVQKQAQQIRHCLIQAQEYRDAAKFVSLATKPLLLYYSIMSLALAEILIKSDGNGSLDKARGEHAHHGLTLRTHPVKKGKFDLETVSKALTASPLAVAGIRRGTFDLWHRVAKGCPIVGKRTISTGKGTFYIYDEVFDPSAERMPLLPKNGFSFWDCLQGCPGMHDYMFELSDASNVVIGEVELTESTLTNVKRYKVLLHPGRTEAIDNIFTANNFASSKFRNVIFSSYESGFEATFELCGGSNVLPPCASWSTDEIRFLPLRRR